MHVRRMIFTVDSHTAGEPTRVVVGGVPFPPGDTMQAKRRYLQEHLDHVRRALMHEPRGHRDMFGAVITPPVTAGADLGVVFMDGGGYLNMCGHGTIGVVTTAVTIGLVPAREPFTDVVLDTPAGRITARAAVESGRVNSVTFRNVPAFVAAFDVPVEVGGRRIAVDVAFGGSFFGLVDAERVGIPLVQERLEELVSLGLAIRDALNRTLSLRHPELPEVRSVDLIEFIAPPTRGEATARSLVVFGDGQVDRSPCGTGTCAEMALLHARGRLSLGEAYVQEGFLGTTFTGRLTGTCRVGDHAAVLPEVTGSAYITGTHQFSLDEDDPLCWGFVMGRGN